MGSRIQVGIGAVALALALTACGTTEPASSPYPNAEAACQASAGDGWAKLLMVSQPAVANRAPAVAILLEPVPADGKDANVGSCITYPASHGDGFGATNFAIGNFPPTSPQTLTYASAIASQDNMPEVLFGRLPDGASRARLVFGDGSAQGAVVGSGLWMIWLTAPAEPVAIEALDASGSVIDRLADPAGLQPTG